MQILSAQLGIFKVLNDRYNGDIFLSMVLKSNPETMPSCVQDMHLLCICGLHLVILQHCNFVVEMQGCVLCWKLKL